MSTGVFQLDIGMGVDWFSESMKFDKLNVHTSFSAFNSTVA